MKRSLLLFVFATTALSQTAVFPGAAVTDSQLMKVPNRVQTTLTLPAAASDTVLHVTSGGRIVYPGLVTIESEIVAVCGVSGNDLTVGYSSCPNVDGRGFDGTAGVSHSINAAVSMYVDAWHHNAVTAEIKAIEAALGANLGNISALIPNPTPVNKGGTGASDAATARTNLGIPNPLTVAMGGTGGATQAAARAALGAAESGANSSITSLTGLLTPLPVNEGGTGVTAAQGNGSKVQLSTGSPTSGNCTKFDANGNTVDFGAPCGTLPNSTAQLQYLRIKPNVANLTTGEFVSPVVLNTTDYNFTAIQPGGSISAGSNTITLAVCPLGVNGTNSNYRMYISGGSGTAEAVLVTGGTCVGTTGTTGGTVIVTAANTHSGAWTIGSATAGCGEAFWSNGGTGNVAIQFPAGTITTYAPCYITASNVSVMGRGIGTTNITNSTLNSTAFVFNGGSAELNLFGFLLNGNASSTTGACAEFDNLSYVTIRDVYCISWPNGFNLNGLLTSSVSNSYVRDLHGGDGVLVQGNSTNALLIDGVIVLSSFAFQSGLHITASGNLVVSNSQFIGNFGGVTKADIWIAPTAGNVFSTDIVNTYADQGLKGLWINPTTGNQVIRTRATHFWASSTTGAAGIHLDSSGGGQIHGFLCSACELSNNAGAGIQVDNGDSIGITGSTVSNDLSGIVLNAGQFIDITGNRIGNGFSGFGGGVTEVYGVYHPGVATSVNITGNQFAALSTTPILLAASSTGLVVSANQGIDDVALTTLASATTVTLSNATPVYYISGTTTVTTLSGANWRGRTLKLIKTDAGSVTVGGGGNIPLAHALAQNGSLTMQFDGTNWY